MKIENLKSEKMGDKARVSAEISWEDSERPRREVYFETEEAFAEDFICNPHTFLILGVINALHHREERVSIDAEICPELRNGLITAMSWLRHWYYQPDDKLVRIEARLKTNLPFPRTPERTGSFFSGGIDSLAAVRANHLSYPPEHPGRIRDGLLILGQNIESGNQSEILEQAVVDLKEVTEDAGINLIPVYTNVRCLDENTEFFLYESHGAVLASVAHAFAPRLTTAIIASSCHVPHFHPWGSHPLLDPNYGSSDLRLRHDNVDLSRFAKTRLLVDWEKSLHYIKVCGPNWPGINCGRCEKCIRTMLALLALGMLKQSSSFPNEISEELVRSKISIREGSEYFYEELLSPLQESGHQNLANIIQRKLYRHYDNEPGWRGKFKRFNRKYFNGRLIRLKRSIIPSKRGN